MELAFRRWPAQHEESGKVVLLHGMGGTGALWRPVAAGLEPDLSVLALDQRGHGGSRPAHPPSFGPIDYGRDVIDTLNAQDFTPAWIVGHSMGVRTACAAAHLAPRSVRGLVLIDLGFYGPAGGGLGETLATFLKVLPPAFPTRAEARQFMEERCPDPSIAQYLMAVLSLGPKGPDSVAFPFDKDALLQTITSVENFDLRPWIREALEQGIPVLALRGGDSGVWSKSEFESEKQRFASMPGIHFEEFEGTGHGLPFDQRVRFVERLRRFIAQSL